MSHIQEIPARTVVWEHTQFSGRRMGAHNDNDPRRWWGVSYAGFASTQDASDAVNPITRQFNLEVRGNLVDRFFWDAGLSQLTQTEQQVGACLVWLFTGNPTESELPLTRMLAETRSAMAGVVMFGGAFTVTELPAERAPEVE